MSVSTLNEYIPKQRTAVAIGVFDGVHLGHQSVLKQNFDAARNAGLAAVCMTFDPHPAQIVAPQHAPLYISCLSQRVEMLIGSTLVDEVVIAPFTEQFSQLSADLFVERVLVQQLNAAIISVGSDFRYGAGRHGSVMDLEAAGGKFGFSVNIVHTVSDHSHRISSTTVREGLLSGDIDSVNRLLGRQFTLRGQVKAGKKLGREIGFPTINLIPEEPKQMLPKDAVYAGYATIKSFDKPIRAAISVGTNPTTDGDSLRKIEAHLLDGFSSDIYGEVVDLSFVKTIRDQVKYDSIEQLINQISLDVENIKQSLPIMDDKSERKTAFAQS